MPFKMNMLIPQKTTIFCIIDIFLPIIGLDISSIYYTFSVQTKASKPHGINALLLFVPLERQLIKFVEYPAFRSLSSRYVTRSLFLLI